MKSYDVVGYTHDGAAYCEDCAMDAPGFDGDDANGEWAPIFADSEWDSAPVCDGCGEVIEDVTVLTVEDDDAPEGYVTSEGMRLFDERYNYSWHVNETQAGADGDGPNAYENEKD